MSFEEKGNDIIVHISNKNELIINVDDINYIDEFIYNLIFFSMLNKNDLFIIHS